MRKLIIAVAVAATGAALSTPTGLAQTRGVCPDHMMPFLVIQVPDGEKKDRNGNGIVCGKVGSDGKFHGGPDDALDDF